MAKQPTDQAARAAELLELSRAVVVQLTRIADTLQTIAQRSAPLTEFAEWEISERLGLPHNAGGPPCPLQPNPPKI